ncbi:hypothetical protein [Arthrobacter sp. PAMC25284]|nr:hypothetical protein [Arthrobacter sp. PAMC25284]
MRADSCSAVTIGAGRHTLLRDVGSRDAEIPAALTLRGFLLISGG